jgi:hypothetical protein
MKPRVLQSFIRTYITTEEYAKLSTQIGALIKADENERSLKRVGEVQASFINYPQLVSVLAQYEIPLLNDSTHVVCVLDYDR